MANISYKIPMVSVLSLIAFARNENGEYRYSLNKNETFSVLENRGETFYDDAAVFYQIQSCLLGGKFRQPVKNTVFTNLYDILIYMDFSGIFDRNEKYSKNRIRMQKAKAMFTSEGITLDFGNGPHKYVAFERSASMSRNSKLSFIRSDLADAVSERLTLGIDFGECQLSKLYAYVGLMFSSGARIEPKTKDFLDGIVIIDNPECVTPDVPYITVKPDTEDKAPQKKYEKASATGEIRTVMFDGMGLISEKFSKDIDKCLSGSHRHASYQIRMPFVKGMVHEVDFAGLFRNAGIKTVTDIWGKEHSVRNISMILTKSQFKCYGRFDSAKENHLDFEQDYIAPCKKYGHTIYISGVGKTIPTAFTELNYQFLNTVRIRSEFFRPEGLPAGWDRNPSELETEWLTKTTEQKYYELLCDKNAQIHFFLDRAAEWHIKKTRDDYLAECVRKNPLFADDPYFVKQTREAAEKTARNYSIGKLCTDGDNRYFAADIMELLYHIVSENGGNGKICEALKNECLQPGVFYAPKPAYSSSDTYALLRNPHIARNEEALVRQLDDVGPYRETYLSHLQDVIMVSSSSLIAERLGGADFDGDMIKTLADPVLNKCILRNYRNTEYGEDSAEFTAANNLPLLLIPSEKPVIANANDMNARFETVKNTFNSRVGQISNAALDRSIIAYNENSDDDNKEKYLEDVQMLAILTGLEIDSAKSGVKPDLSGYFGQNRAERSPFLKYKELIENSEERRSWYEPSFLEEYNEFFEGQDWDGIVSNLEKLPLYAKQLTENTRPCEHREPAMSELFTFAEKDGWDTEFYRNEPKMMDYLERVIAAYNTCLRRIRARKQSGRNTKAKKKDVIRILYMNDADGRYDADELYSLFINLPVERITEIRLEIEKRQWHFMKEDERQRFLSEYLSDEAFIAYHPLFCDFRHHGYRLLPDLISDTENYFRSTDNAYMHYENDSALLKEMIDAYLDNPLGNYRDVVAKAAEKLISRHVLTLNFKGGVFRPIPQVAACGNRTFLYEVYYENLAEYVKEANNPYDE